ncbi:hypothetical protein B0H17DRAFT_1051188 [Mycena rosella]|uniref:Zn(2)-C6 fungal-type domain-containing protein n=1 Tax=Mycena rosella TaxID=1033263 RepID=A0AAD7GPM8_MYCRO|nr:hypothetical protein B0H17DRAFT_1051188 [Mycena rosella]
MQARPRRVRPPKPRTQPLKRGRACLNCRHLKIRCDGMRPVCGNCSRVPKEESCKFADSGARAFRIQNDGINVAGPSTPPHFTGTVGLDDSGPSGAELSAPTSSFSPGNQSVDSRLDAFSDDWFIDLDVQEPPSQTIEVLLQHFLSHTIQSGFFLDPERFRAAVLLPQQIPFGEILRPARSLLYAVCLWGGHLSQEDSLVELKPLFLKRALECTGTEICIERDPTHALQTMQAHILLSNYFILHRLFIPAQAHANTAATLALGYRLHKLGSSPSPTLQSGSSFLMLDDGGEGELVRGFWAVVCLQTSLSLAVECPGSTTGSSILESAWSEIDTPWPGYEIPPAHLPIEGQGGALIDRFLRDEQCGIQASASHAQASVLLHRAMRLAAKWESNPRPTEFSSFTACYIWLDRRVSGFWESIPPIQTFPLTASDSELVLARIVIAAASMRLHRAFSAVDPVAQRKRLQAARAVLQCLSTLELEPSRLAATPIFGTVLSMACGVILDEVHGAEWEHALGLSDRTAEVDHSGLILEFQEGIRVMAAYAFGSPLVEHQLGEIQQRFNSLHARL